MLTSIINVLFALVVTLFATKPVEAELKWDAPRSNYITREGNFKKDHCTGIGTRQYSAILWGIDGGQSWEKTCAAMPANIKGHPFTKPSRCINTTGHMWGEFDVPDSSCGTKWGAWRKERCVMFTQGKGDNITGYRQHASILWDIPTGADWVGMCQTTPVTLTVDGSPQSFDKPHVCALADSSGVAKAIATGTVITIGAIGAVATIPFGGVGVAVAVPAAPFVFKIADGLASQNPLNVWGNVFIRDNTCDRDNSEAIPLPDSTQGIAVPKPK